MKNKIIIILISALSLSVLLTPFGVHSGEFAMADQMDSDGTYLKTFTISAYYSPLPCQTHYATGSYAADIRLNGGGVRGADGTPVYPGMIAAPREYAFGTKMHIPGVGIVAVHDRGGAIKASGGIEGVYDRLDVWMGYGDVGLDRALHWGKRTLDVMVYGQNNSIAEQIELAGYSPDESNYSCDATPLSLTAALEQPVEQDVKVVKPAEVVSNSAPVVKEVSQRTLSLGSAGDDVRALQSELKRLNFFRGEITGYFGEMTEHAVYKFQQSQRLVGDVSSLGAGVMGPKTRDRIREIASSRDFSQKIVADATMEFRNRNRILAMELSVGETDEQVRILQEFLKKQGHFKGAFITDFYGSVTRSAVLDFQLAHGIVASEADTGAGVVGPRTLEVINSLS